MFMGPPITHPLTILIRQSTRTSECQLVPYTGSIAGHICVLAGGGEDLAFAAPAQSRNELEHVPPQLNQGDSRGAEDGRGYRH